MAFNSTPTTPRPVGRQDANDATPTRTQCSAEKADFNVVSIHTAKCSICDKRNGTDQMLRCRGCTWQICQPCQVEREKHGRSLAHGNLMSGAASTIRRRKILHTLKAPDVNGKQSVTASAAPEVDGKQAVAASAETKVGVEREVSLAAQTRNTPGQHIFTPASDNDNVAPATVPTTTPTNTRLSASPSVFKAIASPLSYQRKNLARQAKTQKLMATSDISSDSEYVATDTDIDSPLGRIGSKRRLDKVTSHDTDIANKPLEKRARTNTTNQVKLKQSHTLTHEMSSNKNTDGSGNGAQLDPQAVQCAVLQAIYGAAMPTYAGGQHLLSRPVPAVFHENQVMMPPQPATNKPRLTGEQIMERVRKLVRVKLHTQFGWPISGPTNSNGTCELTLEDHNTLGDVAEITWRILCKDAEDCENLSEAQQDDVRTVIRDAACSFGSEVHSNFPQVFQNLTESRLGLEVKFLTNDQKGELISRVKEAADGKIKELLDDGGVMSTSVRFTKDNPGVVDE